MKTIEVSFRQAESVKDAIDAWCEGYEEATKDVERDRSIEEPEEMLQLVDGMHQTYRDLQEVREMLAS